MNKNPLYIMLILAMLISCSLASEQLGSVVVTAKSNKSINDLAGTVTVISEEDIQKLNATNIKDALVKSTSISITTAGTQYGRQGISIRGSQSDHVLILVDGNKISGTDTNIQNSDYQFSWIPMNMIERIEVIKGSMSSIYGSEAIGGVVNIITKKSHKEFYGAIDTKFGTSSDEGGTLREYAINIGGKVNQDLSVNVGVENKNIDVITKNASTHIEGKEYTNGIVKLAYNIDDTQSISGSYLIGREDRIHANNTKYYDIKRQAYDLSYTKYLDELFVKVDYYVTESENDRVSSTTNHEFENNTLKAEVNIDSIENHFIVFGAETKKEEYIDNSKTFADEMKTNSFFAQDEIEIGKEFILTLGTRFDDHEVFGGEVSPKVNLVYRLSSDQRLKFGYGEGFIAPGFKEMSSNYLYSTNYGFGPITFKGNPNLKPETSKNYELGYEYFTNNATIKFNLFQNDIENLITFGTDSNGDYTYINTSKAAIKGAELEIEYSINEDHNLLFNYTRLSAKDDDTNDTIDFKPENLANLILNSNLPYGITSTFSIKYTGKQEDITNKNLNSFTTANIQFAKMLQNNVTIRVGMDNIADKKLNSVNFNMPGRFTYIGLNYKF